MSTENNPYKIWEKGGPPNVRNAQVAGSSPAASSKKTRYFERNNGFFVLFDAF